MPIMFSLQRPRRRFAVALATTAFALAGCHHAARQTDPLPTVRTARRAIAARVEATGVLEPIDVVQVRSKAAGVIRDMPVDVGSDVAEGGLIAQIDPRDVKNQLDAAMADDVAAVAALRNADLARERADTMFAQQAIALTERDSVDAGLVRAASAVADARSNLDIARQQFEDATVRAPIAGTILSKSVSQGQLVTSATASFGSGVTLVTMANLRRVRLRVNVDEADVESIRPDQHAEIAVDAVAWRSFEGVVEKIEPEAVLDQGVTFFPVLVSIDNRDRLLMPGMNGEVSIVTRQAPNALAVPLGAVRAASELATIARLFSLSPEELRDRIRPSLLPATTTQGSTGAHFVVAALADGGYELRVVRLGAADLQWAQILEGLSESDRVVLLDEIPSSRPARPLRLRLAAGVAIASENSGAPAHP
jgi:HlyD family secretion protein